MPLSPKTKNLKKSSATLSLVRVCGGQPFHNLPNPLALTLQPCGPVTQARGHDDAPIFRTDRVWPRSAVTLAGFDIGA